MPTEQVEYECLGCHDVVDVVVDSVAEAEAFSLRWMTEHEGCEGMGPGFTDEELERPRVTEDVRCPICGGTGAGQVQTPWKTNPCESCDGTGVINSPVARNEV